MRRGAALAARRRSGRAAKRRARHAAKALAVGGRRGAGGGEEGEAGREAGRAGRGGGRRWALSAVACGVTRSCCAGSSGHQQEQHYAQLGRGRARLGEAGRGRLQRRSEECEREAIRGLELGPVGVACSANPRSDPVGGTCRCGALRGSTAHHGRTTGRLVWDSPVARHAAGAIWSNLLSAWHPLLTIPPPPGFPGGA